MKHLQDQYFANLYNKAWQAGVEAATALTPVPMAVQNATGLFDGFDWNRPYEVVSDGVCGFAWVSFPGNTAFGRWARKNGKAKPGYPKGLQIWIGNYNQSYQKKMAHAEAMTDVLREGGVERCYANSRMD